MAFVRMTITLPEKRFKLLRMMSEVDYRLPKMQIEYLIDQEAIRRGLCPSPLLDPLEDAPALCEEAAHAG